MRREFIAMLWALLTVSPAVASDQRVQPQPPLTLSVDTPSPRPEAAITPLDHLTVTVFREPDLTVEDVTVDESGRIVLPMVGAVSAAGKSTEVISNEISGALRRYLKSPQVAVTVKQAASRRVTVTGSVVQPGVYPI